MHLAQQALSLIVGWRRKRKTENRYLTASSYPFAASYCSPLRVVIPGQEDDRILIHPTDSTAQETSACLKTRIELVHEAMDRRRGSANHQRRDLQSALCFSFQFKTRILVSLPRANAVMPCTKSKMLSGLRFSSPRTVSMILDASDLENPPLRRKVSRSSSVRATIRCRAALTPATNSAGEELAKLVNVGAASCAKRCAANFEWRMVISSKFSTPQRLRFIHTARR